MKGGHTYQAFQEFDVNKKNDIIILGSSHAYRGYDPRIFRNAGYDTYNLGTSAQVMSNSYVIAENYINKQNCGLVILDVFEGPFMSDGLESSADLIQNISSHKAATQIGFTLADIRAINMLTLRWLNKDKSPFYVDSSYVGMGFSVRTDSITTDIDYRTAPFEANNKQVDYLEKILGYFAEQGIATVVVSHPLAHEYKRDNHERFRKLVVPIIERSGAIYLDYTFNHNLNSKDHYYDHNHLNQAGVGIFNSRLIQDLKSKGLL